MNSKVLKFTKFTGHENEPFNIKMYSRVFNDTFQVFLLLEVYER